ncbi:MAG: alpha/beta hydrolase [Acidobacteriota bacterium]|nr:alpha/beta hydrolase [Acidobacteriota bacterium]
MKRAIRITAIIIALLVMALVIFWYGRPEDVNFEEARAALSNSAYSRFVVLDGVRVHYQDKGNGTPLVLIHGYTASTYAWKDVFEPLAQQYHVVAIDLKGFGFSGKPDGDYTRRAQSGLVIKLMNHLNIDRAIVCGNSMGGEVSLNVARYHPERVRALILVDSAGVTVSNSTSVSPGFTQWPYVGPAVTALALTSDSLVRAGLKKSYFDDSKVTDEMVAAYYRPLKTRGGQRAAFLARRQASQQAIEPEIGKIRQPTLILWGAEDELIPVEAGRKLNSLIAGSRLVVLDNCGHVPQSENPDRFLREVASFIATLTTPVIPATGQAAGQTAGNP